MRIGVWGAIGLQLLTVFVLLLFVLMLPVNLTVLCATYFNNSKAT